MAFALAIAATAGSASAGDSWGPIDVSGFALLRPETRGGGRPLDDHSFDAQVQAGLDWRPSSWFMAHVHLLARNNDENAQRGRAGVVEAFAQQTANVGLDRVRVMEGAFFLPTSRENVDALWENPYTITSSALNSWMGEEFRPIGIDASYRHQLARFGALTAGGTVFRGNDTFGAIPIDRGWSLRDDWALLGEHIPVTATAVTSVSAETDHRLGWSARAKWNDENGSLQLTRLDNRSEGERYDEFAGWATKFDIAGGNYTWRGWTAAAEYGWGTTAIETSRGLRTFGIEAKYLLISRKFSDFRASVRGDQYVAGTRHGHAYTAAFFWEPAKSKLRTGIEAISAPLHRRVELELRYFF